MPRRTRKMVAVSFRTDAATKSVDLGPGEGNFSISALEGGMVEAIPVMDRGTFDELVEGDDKAITWSITVHHDATLTNGAATRVMDAILGTGYYSGETTADPGGVVWTGDVVVTVTRSGSVDTFALNNCRLLVDYAEAQDANTLTINGTAYGKGSSERPVVITSA